MLPVEIDTIPKKIYCKQNLIKLDGFSSSKIVFALLTEVIKLHVGLITIYVKGPSLEKLFLTLFLMLGFRKPFK